MNGEPFTARVGKININFFGAVTSVIGLMEGEGNGHSGTGRDDQRRGGVDRKTWTIVGGTCPKRGCSEAHALQN